MSLTEVASASGPGDGPPDGPASVKAATASAVSAAAIAEPWKQLTRTHWFFVFGGWLTAIWGFYIVIDTFGGHPVWGLDFLPVVAGASAVVAGWRAAVMHSTIRAAVDGLREGAALDLSGDMAAFDRALKRRVRLWWIATGTAVAACFGLYMAWAYSRFDGSLPMAIGMVVLNSGVGFVIGGLLGGLLGYGQILDIMRANGIAIGSIDTPQAREALGKFEGLLVYVFWLTAGMCHWFAVWFVLWFLGFDDHRSYQPNYSWLFILFWIVSFGLYLFAARAPILAFRARHTELQGGTEGQEARRRQLEEVRDDLARLASSTAGEDQYERRALERLLDEFKARAAPLGLPQRWQLDMLAVWIAILLGASIVWTLGRVPLF